MVFKTLYKEISDNALTIYINENFTNRIRVKNRSNYQQTN